MPIPSNNEILAQVTTDTGTNLLTQSEFLADAQRLTGNQAGIARLKLVNKMLRQLSKVGTAVAQFMANRQATDITDSMTAAAIDLALSTAINGNTTAVLNVSGTADALVANFTPAATTRQPGIMVAKALAANVTTTPTLARDGQPAKIMVKGGNAVLAVGDIVANGLIAFYYDAALDKEVLLNPATPVTPVVGRTIGQIVTFQTGALASGSTAIPADNTIPQNTEGDQYMQLAITPLKAGSTLIIDVILNGTEATNTSDYACTALFQDANVNALATGPKNMGAPELSPSPMVIQHVIAGGLTPGVATTFKVRAGLNVASPFLFNGGSGPSALYGGTISSRITITEVLP